MRRLIHLVLIIAIAIGVYHAWQTGRERAHLQSQYDRLVRVVGDLGRADVTRPQVLALNPDDPLHFVWRIVLPPAYDLKIHSRSGGGSSSGRVSLPGPGGLTWSASALDAIARVRLRENPENGQVRVFTTFGSGSSLMSVGDGSVADALRRYGDRLRVEQIGADGVATLEPGKPRVLLRLSWPEDLHEVIRNAISPVYRDQLVPTLYELTMTPEPPSPTSPPPGGTP